MTLYVRTAEDNMEEKKMKTGLVLEGGAMRGIYTAGVLDVLMENDIYLDGVMGVSAGAIHGCSYASHQKGRSIRYYQNYREDKRFMGPWNLLHSGEIVGSEFCYHTIPEKLDPYDYEAFNHYQIPFYAVCTNVENGEPEYVRITDMYEQIDALRASASMPYVSKIVEFEGMKLLDGGCSDSIPVKAMQKLGYEKNVVVMTRQEGYRKKPSRLGMAKAAYRKYPEFVETLKRRPETYNRQVEEIEEMVKNGEVFMIRPSINLQIGRMETNVSKIQLVYYIGRRDALSQLEALKEWLGIRSEKNN